VNSNNKRWIVHRRYSDFILLNKKLQKEFPSLCLSLPPKRWFRNNFNTYFIKKRKEGLQEFMRNLFALKQLFESKNVQMFFRLNDPPDPSEDLETSQMYCESLEQSCNDLRVVINQQGMEITRLNRDLQEMSFTQDKTNLDKNEATTGLLLAKNNLEQRLADLTTTINQKNDEITKLKEDYRQSEAYSNAVRLTERHKRDQQIREHGKVFMDKQQKIDEIYNNIVNSLADLSKVKIDVGGRCIDVKHESITEQEKELKAAMYESRKELESLYSEHMDFYRKELEESKVMIEKTEKLLQNNSTEIDSLKKHLVQVHESHSGDVLSRDQCIQQYQTQICSQNHYISNLEQKYFYSLILGLKLNMALYGHVDDLLHSKLDPASLFLEVRDYGVNIENWPSWIARKFAKAVD